MTTIGITENGFVIETLDEIRTDLIQRLRGRWGKQVNFGNESAAGHLVGTIAERYAKLQELIEAVYRAFSRDTATGDGLVNINLLSGTLPLEPFPSSVTLTLTGTPSTIVAEAKQAETDDGVIFATLAEATIGALPARAASTAYALKAQRTSSGNVYVVTVAGTTSAGAGPTGTASAITDGSVTWRYVGAGTGAVDVEAQATETGPLEALSGVVKNIKTPVAGWSGVLNLLDADLGENKETDESYRLRGQEEQFSAGSHSVNAIRSDLLALTGVTGARVLQNVSDVTDGDGMPPHTVEALVQGGDDTEIAEYLLDRGIGVGWATFGNTTVVVQDDQGVDYSIKFSRPTPVLIYVDADVIIDEATFPDDGVDQINLAIITWGDARASGLDAVAAAISSQIFQVAGVLDVPAVRIGLSPSPVASTTIVIPLRSQATYDTSRISISTTPGTP